MRWPWQPRPGMVRVSQRRLIALLEGAMRAAELREEIRGHQAHSAALKADMRARELLAEREQALGTTVTSAMRDELLTDLPVTGDGAMHEAAFLAWVDAQLWAGWSELWTTAPDQNDDTRRSL